MARTVHCPRCGLELEAPLEVVGKPATCPRCASKFIVSRKADAALEALERQVEKGDADRKLGTVGGLRRNSGSTRAARFKGLPDCDRDESSSTDAQVPYQSAAVNSFDRNRDDSATSVRSMNDSLEGEQHGQVLNADSRIPKSDAKHTATAATSQVDHRRSQNQETATPTLPVRAKSRCTNEGQSNYRRPSFGSQSSESPRRNRQSAKLLADGKMSSRLQLGTDGSLPELVVAETAGKRRPTSEHAEQSSLLLIAVLSASVVTSMFMLFMPTSFSTLPDVNRKHAIEQLEHYYLGKEPFQAHQVLLREAIREEHRGNRLAAITRYREVLDMLHAEGLDPNRGISGPTFASRPPNDSDLEEQLQILIRKRN